MIEHLAKISKILIPFRYYSKTTKTPLYFTEELQDCGGTAMPAEDLKFFEFFADVLFFNEESGNDRIGCLHAISGLEDILIASLDIANSPLDFKYRIISALEKFRAAIEIYGWKISGIVSFSAPPEKKNNIVTYYLTDTRKDYVPATSLLEVFEQSDSGLIGETDFVQANKFLRRAPGLYFSEPKVKIAVDVLAEPKEGVEISAERKLHLSVLIKQSFIALAERWRKLCVTGYCATRLAAETPAPSTSKLISRSDTTAWAVSCALSYIPSEPIENGDVFGFLQRGIINDALRLCKESEKYSWGTVNQIGRHARYVLYGTRYPWRTGGRKRKNKPDDSSTGNGKADDVVELHSPESIVEEDAWTDEINVQKEEGAGPDEFELLTEYPTVETSPSGSSSESSAFRVIYNEASWGKSHLTDETLGVVWAWLQTQFIVNSENDSQLVKAQASLLFFELILHFGFPPNNLLNSRIDIEVPAPDKSEDVRLLQIDETSISVRPVRAGGDKAFAAAVIEEDTSHYMPNGQILTLPLPALVSIRLRSICSAYDSQKAISFYELLGEKSAARAKKALKKTLKPLESILGETVSVEKIAKSVRTLLREQGNLTDLEIALLSGEIPRRTASQMFYTNYSVAGVTCRYLKALRELIKSIVENSREYVAHLKLDPIIYIWSQNYSPIHNFDSESLQFARVGSPFVANPVEFSIYLNGLKREIKKTSDFVLRHNRHTASAALVLMTLTGLRPLELLSLTAQHMNLDAEKPTMAVIAKINQKHSEWRTLELAPEAAGILRNYQIAAAQTRRHPKLLTEYKSAEINARIGDSFFFYLRRTLSPVKFSTRRLGELVRDHSYLEYEPFPWKLNAPRHLYRTTACELQVPEKIINSLMGHQTMGMESLGLFSAEDRSNESIWGAKISAELSKILNLNYD